MTWRHAAAGGAGGGGDGGASVRDATTAYAFWKPGTAGPGAHAADRDDSRALDLAGGAMGGDGGSRGGLPVDGMRAQVCYLVESHAVVLVAGETGSGKSTRIPAFLLDAGWANGGRRIAVAMPRRLAAVELAKHVAAMRGSALGGEVGYRIRFGSMVSRETRLVFATAGSLLSESLADPLLSRYSVVVVDEAHDRTLETEILLALLKRIRRARPDLRLVIISATLEVGPLVAFFSDPRPHAKLRDVTLLVVPGSSYPVEVVYVARPLANYQAYAVELVSWIHATQPAGDVLIFCPGLAVIRSLVAALEDRAYADMVAGIRPAAGSGVQMAIHALHAKLDVAGQRALFERKANVRRIIVATNVAESAVTLPGVVYVIDSGLVKRPTCSPVTGATKLTVTAVSKAEAAQRAGRAGRTAAGTAFRLYTRATHAALAPHAPPVVQTADLERLVLTLARLGVARVSAMQFVAPPSHGLVLGAQRRLVELGALEAGNHALTHDGFVMASLPLSAMAARALLAGSALGCGMEVLMLVAVLQVEPLFAGRAARVRAGQLALGAAEGDFLTYINAFVAFRGLEAAQRKEWAEERGLSLRALARAGQVFDKLMVAVSRVGIALPSIHVGGEGAAAMGPAEAGAVVLRALAAGFGKHNAARHVAGNVYKAVSDGAEVSVDSRSVVDLVETWPPLIMYADREAEASGSAEIVREVSAVESSSVLEQFNVGRAS
ncbi:DEAH box polypeptide 35 [Thecamonas trahens ATCC 50062]|uniref:DEAH box polypeptide 35 n=1 Tax=Thecamonas trahens ATCC 50062 TaxID=461836 RepID=A0A0L0DR01_THETB|nr:DEAH box polypeptide 35 [Thecamonas trahens ATCC 50062]KNC53863.1 DEAH box polypeptide 35 [Thecamonas trahens ATCC 50062]|eukprot:XP_013754243.1 DEAH box polypeptide 35 [Thecamonas trahens ATCC 50062]